MDGQYSTAFMPMSPEDQQRRQQQQQQQQQQQPFIGYAAMQNQHHHSQPTNESSTLPPIQPAGQHFSNLPPLHTGSQFATPSHTPQTPGMNSAMSHQTSGFSTMSTPVTAGSMPPPSSTYMPGPNPYTTAQSPGQASPASVNPNGLPSNRLQDIRPMPSATNFNSPVQPFPSFNPGPSVPQQQGQQQYMPVQEPEPTHVVGSQGRRGILPSVPGRPPAPPTVTNGNGKSLIPQKDADGKFPCPHCTKTYLHAKHLKRHLLRHTGDRPYMCHLCHDTFSRSDILKRHFQKCSIRRGNPSGQNHLAGQRRNTTSSATRLSIGNAEQSGLGNMSDAANTPTSYSAGSLGNGMNGSPSVNGDGSSYPSSIGTASARTSRANSLMQPQGAFGDGRHPIGLGIPTLPSSNSNGDHHQVTSSAYASGIPAYAMRAHSASNPVPPSYHYGTPTSNGNMYGNMKTEDHGANNYTASAGPLPSQRGQGPNMEWHSMFNTGTPDSYMSQQQGSQAHVPKSEHGVDSHSFQSTDSYGDPFMNGLQNTAQGYGDDGSNGMTR